MVKFMDWKMIAMIHFTFTLVDQKKNLFTAKINHYEVYNRKNV